jgi:cysteinyl-tRNA synthetase
MGLLTDSIADWFNVLQTRVEAHQALREILIIRAEARKNKDFKKADLIRDLLGEYGLKLKDEPDGKVTPEYEGFGMFDYWNALDLEGRRLFLARNSYEAGEKVTGTELTASYQRMIAKVVLEKLK